MFPDALLKLRTASAVSGLSGATIYRKSASDPTFPKLVKIGARCTRIRAGDLMAWLAAQAGARPGLALSQVGAVAPGSVTPAESDEAPALAGADGFRGQAKGMSLDCGDVRELVQRVRGGA